jgi:type IV pilus assembly protein PilY1
MTTTHRPTPSGITLGRRIILCLTAATLQFSSLPPAWAALAQKPLLASVGARPQPNIMLTMDTSGSMNFRHMPDSTTTVNGVAVPVVNGKTWLNHPSDDYQATVELAGTMPANKNETDSAKLLTQIKLRSPDINTIYYNPRQRYIPWAATATTRYPDASAAKAFVNPLKQTASDKFIDLTANLKDPVCLEYSTIKPKECVKPDPNPPVTFWPGLYYVLNAGNTTDPTVTGNYTLYDINDATQSFPKYADRTDCSGSTTCTQAEEQKNFANWFVYYRTRMLLAKAALSETFYKLDNIARVGWTTLSYASNPDHRYPKGFPIKSRLQPLTATNRQAFINAIQTSTSFDPTGSTPLRVTIDQVGKYFMDTSNFNPWNDTLAAPDPDPDNGKFLARSNNDTSAKSACRRSYNILTTDGYYNDTGTDNARLDKVNLINAADLVGDLDGVNSKETPPHYTAAAPYRDNTNSSQRWNNSLADYALKYWATDLQPLDTTTGLGIADKVAATANDPATWQHLTQFTVGIGVAGTLDPKNPDAAGSDFSKLKAGTLFWPNPLASDPAKTDDMWHAAVNSRGAFYNVKDAQSLSKALSDAIGVAKSQTLNEGGVAVASAGFASGNRKYVPSYTTGSWQGDVSAFLLDNNGKQVGTTPIWQASTGVPAFASRHLWIWNPGNGLGAPSQFTWGEMGSANQAAMTSGSDDLVKYLRGDTSNEGPAAPKFRVRGGTLADFINGNPEYLQVGTNALVFVGGNGGFLHAFSDVDGHEVFGYVPRGVLPNLYKLSQQNYDHQYFVDGPIVISDAVLSTNASKVLIGALGAGGNGLYAINVTNLSTVTPLPVLWDNTATNNADVGHIFAAPEIGKLANGQWKVFVGNGFDSASGKAALLVIDLATGAIDSVVADNGTGNGLGGVKLIRDKDQYVVAAYAGDLKGHLWRFDYVTADNGHMSVGYSGNPLFTATSSAGAAQPITAAPTTFYQTKGGNIVLFGTGKLIEDADKSDTSVQSIYGVWDKTPAATSSVGLTPDAISRTNMDQMTITASTTSTGYFDVKATTTVTAQNWMGWFMDLSIEGTNPGQRLIYPITPLKDFALISTVTPAGLAAECDEGFGEGFIFLLPARTGAQYTQPVFDVDGDGVIDPAKDALAAGRRSQPTGNKEVLREGPNIRIEEPTTKVDKNDPLCNKTTGKCNDGTEAKTYCLVDCTIVDRVWKRLINNIPQP